MSKPVPVKRDEVQGIILRGYEKLEAARFVLLKITDPVAARRWLGELANDLTSAKVTSISKGPDSVTAKIDLGEGKRVVSFADPDGRVFRLIQLE